MSLKIQEYRSLIKDYEDLPFEEYSPTLLEITGYSHREDIVSNILAFYFDSTNPHGFSNLLVEALLDITGRESDDSGREELVVENVEREVLTQENKYIDLVITTNSHVIGIENKIYAELNNPLSSYKKYIKRKAAKHKKQAIFLLLTMKEKTYPKVELGGFIHITFSQFFQSIEKLIGKTLGEAELNYLTYFVDLKKTINNMKSSELGEDFKAFLIEHHEKVNSLYSDVFKRFEKFSKKRLNHLNDVIDLDSLKEFREEKLILKKGRLEAVRFYKFKEDVHYEKKRLNLQIKVRLQPTGWAIELWDHGTDKEESLKSFMDELGLKTNQNRMFVRKSSAPYDYSYIHKEFDLEENIDVIRAELQYVFQKVSDHINMNTGNY